MGGDGYVHRPRRMARRIGHLSLAFRRDLAKLGPAGSPLRLATGATVSALMAADELPGPVDSRIAFAPGFAHVRRVTGRNLWIRVPLRRGESSTC